MNSNDIIRSDLANDKVATKRIPSGYPVQRFQNLVTYPATLAKLQIKLQSEIASSFVILSLPTNLQTEAFRLVELRLS
ncbi:MAG: hypothetical protein OXC62_16800 [Aestuariivita sp.]|nr:hypothetical protein [Aestuariivita sp.]